MTISRSHRRYRSRSRRGCEPGLPRSYDLRFCSIYTYSPKGQSITSMRSRLLCSRVKGGALGWLKSYSTRVCSQMTQHGQFNGFFSERTVLVPVPVCDASTSLPRWSAQRLAFIFQEMGLGESVWIGLQRVKPVERSSRAWMWERPTVLSHYQSFVAMPVSTPPEEVVLVDDVVTKGRTLLAAAMRLRQAFPSTTVRAFALVRTMGFLANVERLFDPCQGQIRWDGRDAHRDP